MAKASEVQRRRWREEIEAWRQSGESLSAWARRRGESRDTLEYWKRRFAGKDAASDAGTAIRLIPASGFYEWHTEGRVKQPWYFSLKSGEPLAMGGLWESWRAPDGQILRTCAIITTGPNAVMAPVHDRMPVIIPAEHWQDWLAAPPEAVSVLLTPPPAEPLQAWKVDRRVSRATEDDPGLVAPMAETT